MRKYSVIVSKDLRTNIRSIAKTYFLFNILQIFKVEIEKKKTLLSNG